MRDKCPSFYPSEEQFWGTVYWVGQKIHSVSSIRCYGKTWVTFFWPTQYIVWQRLESQLLATASSKMQSLLAFLLPCSLFLFFHLPNKLSVTKSLFQSPLLSLRAVIWLGKWPWATFAQHFKLKRYNCLRTPNCHSYMIDWKATFLSIKF